MSSFLRNLEAQKEAQQALVVRFQRVVSRFEAIWGEPIDTDRLAAARAFQRGKAPSFGLKNLFLKAKTAWVTGKMVGLSIFATLAKAQHHRARGQLVRNVSRKINALTVRRLEAGLGFFERLHHADHLKASAHQIIGEVSNLLLQSDPLFVRQSDASHLLYRLEDLAATFENSRDHFAAMRKSLQKFSIDHAQTPDANPASVANPAESSQQKDDAA